MDGSVSSRLRVRSGGFRFQRAAQLVEQKQLLVFRHLDDQLEEVFGDPFPHQLFQEKHLLVLRQVVDEA